MKNIKPRLILSAFVLLTFGCEKEETKPDIKIVDEPIGEPTAQPQKIEATLRTNLVENLDGSGFNNTYDLRIYLPAAYEENKDLPIIYLVNDWFNEFSVLVQPSSILFARANESMVSLGLDALIVSVDTDFRSDIDFQGGEDNFRTFIHTELMPYIEEKYPHNTSSRTLMGMGLGAGFALNSMFLEDASQPVFENFIANDPSGTGLLIEKYVETNEFPQNKGDLKLFVSIADVPNYELIKEHIGEIFLNDYSWLTAEFEEFLSDDHKTVIKPGFTAGLEYIFQGE